MPLVAAFSFHRLEVSSDPAVLNALKEKLLALPRGLITSRAGGSDEAGAPASNEHAVTTGV